MRSARGQIAAALVLFLLLLVAISGVAVWSARDHQSRLSSLEHRSQAATALESARSNFYMEAIGLIAGAFVPDPRLLEAATLGRAGVHQDLAEARRALEAAGDTKFLLLLEELTVEMGELEKTADQALPILEAGGTAAAMSLVPQVANTVEDTVVRLQEMADGQQAAFASEREAASRAADRVLLVLVALSSGAFLVAVGRALTLNALVVRPLASLRAKARAITAGALEVRAEVSGPEEIACLARDFNEMTDALAAKTEEYIATTNLTGDIIGRADEEGSWTFLNDAACQFFGKPREELLGTDARASLHPEDLEPTVWAVEEAAATKEPIRGFVNRQITPMGTRVVEWNACPLFNEEGRYVGIQMTGRDITERKQMEEALAAKTEEYIDTLNLTGDIIVRLDKDGRFTFLNDAACQSFGTAREELLGSDAGTFMHPEDLEAAAQAVENAIQNRGPVMGFESRIVSPSGIRVVEWKGHLLFDEEAQYAGIQVTGRDITERKQAEEALRESEEKYRRLVQDSVDGIVIVQGLEVKFVNQALAEMCGAESEEEMLGCPFTDFVSPDYRDLMVERAGARQEGEGVPARYEFKALRGDGREFDAELCVSRITYQGRPAVQGVVRDITERKQAEEALRESEARYRLLAENTSDLIWTMDLGLRYTYMSPAITRMRGYTVEEIVGASVAETMTPASLEVARKTLAEELAIERMEQKDLQRSRKLELEMYCKDGSTMWTEMSMTFLRDADGKPVGILGVTRDISERKKAGEALRDSERRYRLLAENISDVIWTLDMNLRYTYMSPSVTRMRGYSVDQIVGATVKESLTRASLEVATKAFAEELARENLEQRDLSRWRTLELEMNCKDGSTVWTEVTTTFLRDADGRPVGVLGVTRDISERKKAEQERERLHAELEVRAITDSLTGLYDHAHFYQRLAEEIERSRRYNHGFAMVMLDVDDFKRFNDSRGHQAGDKALRLVADCIRTGLRRSDLAFRYGGDEFAAILPYADSSKAGVAVSRINRRIAKRLKEMDGGAAARLSLSAGVACFPHDGTTADDLVRIADAALYSAKWVARARDIMGQREDIQSLVSALVSRRAGAQATAGGAIFRPEALHEQQARIVSSVASAIAVALKDAGVPQALEDPDLQVVATVGAAAEIKDRYVRGHPERTSEGAAALAEEIGLSPERVRDIRIAGLLHDIGKVTVSEGILNKPGQLTRREFASIKEHPVVGATLISQVRGFERLVPIVRHHHERFDGKGYPDGLAGEDIPLEARILSVVDVFDAMTHQRSYRKALSEAEAIDELERSAGTRFDPTLVKAFLALVKKRGDELAAPAQAASEDRQPAAVKVPARGKGQQRVGKEE